MMRYLMERLAWLAPTLFGVSVLIFVMMRVLPGDAAVAISGGFATQQDLESLREYLGLDQPIYIQYFRWIWHCLYGDFGRSIQLNAPVLEVILPKFYNTLVLTAGALAITISVGWLVGILSAVRQYSLADRFTMLITLAGISLPAFWLGLVLMSLFAYKMRWLPATGMYSLRGGGDFADLMRHLVLPAITTAAVPTAIIARMTRSSMLETIKQDYIRTIRAKGLPEVMVIFKHALKNAFPQIVNITGLQVGYLLGGAIFTEVVFSWPGIGLMLYSAISARDYPLVQGVTLVSSLCFIVINLLIDVVHTWLDPRVKPA
ncbi:MAG: ABC transporter permease [Nitrospinae bacterium]|nr:ABC transporter permease [Nitrospinota bacterium]